MNGIILINKPCGINSSKVVATIKKITKEKCGHLGTLDPLAEGVLPICIGRATRLFDYFLNKKKEYVAEFTFGEETDTLDLEGQVVKTSSHIPTKDEIEKAISSHFLGDIQQVPPIYSSKKVEGTRAYDMARKNKEIDLKPVAIHIFSFECTRQIDGKTFELKIVCSAGTYIRALARDLGAAVGSCATMTRLVRTKVGDFDIANCRELDKINIENIEKQILPIKAIVDKMPLYKVNITEENLKNLLNGKNLLLTNCQIREIVKVYNNEKVVGLGTVNENGCLKIKTYLL